MHDKRHNKHMMLKIGIVGGSSETKQLVTSQTSRDTTPEHWAKRKELKEIINPPPVSHQYGNGKVTVRKRSCWSARDLARRHQVGRPTREGA